MDVIELFKEYIDLVSFGICYGVCEIIKASFPEFNKNWLPSISGLLGIVIVSWSAGFDFTPVILLSGLFSGLAACGFYDFTKGFKHKEESHE